MAWKAVTSMPADEVEALELNARHDVDLHLVLGLQPEPPAQRVPARVFALLPAPVLSSPSVPAPVPSSPSVPAPVFSSPSVPAPVLSSPSASAVPSSVLGAPDRNKHRNSPTRTTAHAGQTDGCGTLTALSVRVSHSRGSISLDDENLSETRCARGHRDARGIPPPAQATTPPAQTPPRPANPAPQSPRAKPPPPQDPRHNFQDPPHPRPPPCVNSVHMLTKLER
jgi:hypothetical protein